MDETPHAPEPTTTHAEWGAGHPRLLVSAEDGERSAYEITTDEVLIGSAADANIRIPGAASTHAVIRHDERDEYVLTLYGRGEMNANPRTTGEGPGSEILRTGSRFTIAGWKLVFARDEFADHGRPYGGREGGELSDQPSQPERPDYTDPEDRPGPVHEVRDA